MSTQISLNEIEVEEKHVADLENLKTAEITPTSADLPKDEFHKVMQSKNTPLVRENETVGMDSNAPDYHNGNDYQYRIRFDDDLAFNLATLALNEEIPYPERHVEIERQETDHLIIKTTDGLGHLAGLFHHRHSAQWQVCEQSHKIDEYKSSGGNVVISGSVRTNEPMHGNEYTDFETVVQMSLSEFESVMEEDGHHHPKIQEAIRNVTKDPASF